MAAGRRVPRTLHIDASKGGTAGHVLAALVDLGVAPSPILHALGDLDVPAHLLIEETGQGHRVTSEPGEAPVAARGLADEVRGSPLPPSAAKVAAGALARLIAATEPSADMPCAFQHSVDAGIVLSVCGAAMAIQSLSPERVVVSRVAVDAEPSDATIDLLGDVADALDFGAADALTDDAAALLTQLVAPSDWGRPEPAWTSPVARGRSGGLSCALGETD